MSNKYCHNCGKKQMSSMLICPQCGSKQFSDEPVVIIPIDQLKNSLVDSSSNTVLSKATDHVSTQNDPVSNYSPTINKSPVRPWVRFWAKYIDINIFGFCTGFLMGLTFPIYMAESNYLSLGIVSMFLYVFIEPIFISEFGTTFGRWLLKTKVVTRYGTNNSYMNALKRSFHVWWRGCGLGIPIINLFTFIVNYRILNRENITPWDKSSGYLVKHEKIGVLRIIVATMLILIFVVLTSYGIKNTNDNKMNKMIIQNNSQVSF